MSEGKIRQMRLKELLAQRQVPDDERSAYLQKMAGFKQQQASNIVNGHGSFGDKVARRIEDALGVARYTLEDDGLPPDAAAIAAAFERLPVNTPEELARRKHLYMAIMAMLQPFQPDGANTP